MFCYMLCAHLHKCVYVYVFVINEYVCHVCEHVEVGMYLYLSSL